MPSSDKIRRECKHYIASQLFPEVPRGQLKDGQRSENLEALTFPDQSFDLVITQDVFEHVLRPAKAFAEIARTLKPAGAHVYTVPYYRGKKTVVRAEPNGNEGITHLMKPEYHANPIDAAGSLVVTEWGDELCDFVFQSSRMTTTIFNFYDPRYGLKGEFLDVLISRKASVADLVAESGGDRVGAEDIMSPSASESFRDVLAIAFHLPQFHPIAENDEWWGKGFTEWTNVVKAAPRFPGHYQPHLPADLGFYDLRLPETRAAQAELAASYGIHGFCYYHYWFHGRQVLERPVNEIWKSGEPDFPFCLCWANEHWSRRWDGSNNEVLLEQRYSASDDLAHIRALIPIFLDRRYVRVMDRPFFAVYRASELPDPAKDG